MPGIPVAIKRLKVNEWNFDWSFKGTFNRLHALPSLAFKISPSGYAERPSVANIHKYQTTQYKVLHTPKPLQVPQKSK